MKLIVGLGNPGEKFRYTRHNLGFLVIDQLVKELTPIDLKPLWQEVDKPKLVFCQLNKLILLKPQTYMNLSGLAVSYLKEKYQIENRNLWVVHDDLDLPLGKLKIRRGGASAGHHGIESIMQSLKTANFVRFRLGISKNFKDLSSQNLHRRWVKQFVLSPFSRQEESQLRKMIKKAVAAIKVGLTAGLTKAMNQFN